MAKMILTTLKDPYGLEIALYRDGDVYGVASVSSHGRLIPLAAPDTFTTYAEAHDRLEDEWRQRVTALAETREVP